MVWRTVEKWTNLSTPFVMRRDDVAVPGLLGWCAFNFLILIFFFLSLYLIFFLLFFTRYSFSYLAIKHLFSDNLMEFSTTSSWHRQLRFSIGRQILLTPCLIILYIYFFFFLLSLIFKTNQECYSRFHFHVLNYCQKLRRHDNLSVQRMPRRQIELWNITLTPGNFWPY